METAAVRTRRLFFGLWPDDATRAALSRATQSAARNSGGKPVPPENFHLTLAFLGSVAEEQVSTVVNPARPLRLAPLELMLDRFGWFEGPRVLWLGPSAELPTLTRFADELRQALVAAGVPPDARPFRAHVSIARKVTAAPDLEPPLPVGLPVLWPVRGFALLQSETLSEGVRYSVLAEFPASAG